MKKKFFTPLIMLLLFVLVACGGDPQELVDAAATEAAQVAATARALADDLTNDEATAEPPEAPTEEPTKEPTEVPTEEPTEVPTEEPIVEVAEGESPIWAEIKTNTLQDPVILTGVILDDVSVTQQEGSVLLSAGFEFTFFESPYLEDHPLLDIRAGDSGSAIILNIAATSLDDVFVPIAKRSETELGSVAVASLFSGGLYNYTLADVSGPNEPVMEGDLIEISLGNENSSEPPYYLTVYRGLDCQLIAEFQLVKK